MSRLSRKWLAVPAATLALAAAGCGDDDDNSGEPAASSTPTTTQQSTAQEPAEPAPEEAAPAGGEDAVKQVILDHTFEGSCETMTDKFLDTQAFSGDTREEKCAFFEKTFQKPQYSEDDVKFRKIEIDGNKAVVTIGSDIANIESDYSMVYEGGRWQIDEVSL